MGESAETLQTHKMAQTVTRTKSELRGAISLGQLLILQLRWYVRTLLNDTPLYLALVSIKGNLNERPVTKNTEVVIEGFPRSGNTFAVVAFQSAQDRPIEIAHHVHAPAQIIQAVRQRIPAMVLVRDPEKCILSFRSFAPHISSKQCLKEYVRFHKRIHPYRQGFLVGMFDAVVSDFGEVIRQLNLKFAADFGVFHHREENVRRCFNLIERLQAGNEERPSEAFVPRPSIQRDRKKKQLRASFWAEDLGKMRREAYGLYKMFASYAEFSGHTDI